MFGRSSNAMKAMNDIQRLKMSGGTAKLSPSQIVALICNSQDAKRNLSQEEFEWFCAVFSEVRSRTKCETVNMNGYLDMCKVIIRTFEKRFPYLLVDGEHSENIELRNQIKIRKLYADGIKFDEALTIYENDYDSIPPYTNYDPLKHKEARQMFDIMETFMADFITKYMFSRPSLADLGFISGVADAIYLLTADKYIKDISTEENAITTYTMLSFAVCDYSDSQIDTIMKRRLDIASNFYKENVGKPNSQVIDTIANKTISEFKAINPEINYWAVQNSLSEYHQKIFNSLTSRLI